MGDELVLVDEVGVREGVAVHVRLRSHGLLAPNACCGGMLGHGKGREEKRREEVRACGALVRYRAALLWLRTPGHDENGIRGWRTGRNPTALQQVLLRTTRYHIPSSLLPILAPR